MSIFSALIFVPMIRNGSFAQNPQLLQCSSASELQCNQAHQEEALCGEQCRAFVKKILFPLYFSLQNVKNLKYI